MSDFFRRWRYGKKYGYEVLFKNQTTHPVGKPGVIIAEMGQPEQYELEFYSRYMDHVMRYMLPPFIRSLVLSDNGIALVDPDHVLTHKAFKPRQLIDGRGSFTNRAGKPYVECEVTWRPPGMKKNLWDHGYFLYKGEGKSGVADICEKVGAKVVGWYYGKLLPEKKVAWRHQMRKIYDEAVAQLKRAFPQALFQMAYYVDESSLRRAVEDLLAAGCETIIYQSINGPVYSDFEDYAYALPRLYDAVHERASVICADQLGNQPAMREAYLHILSDQLERIPATASVLVILAVHGHPFKNETADLRAPEFRAPLTAGVQALLEARSGRGEILWSNDEYADPYWDPKNERLETCEAYQYAINAGFDYAIELPTEFPAENTDLMIWHAMKKFIVFSDYDANEPIPYPDWEQPLVRRFHARETTGIYAGCPVGPYRHHIVEAVVKSIGAVLEKTRGE
ncbi:MAG: hypothetical protein JXA21_00080 [Anaerolineae bacterium]|nr:hypothetical protein [Anaerolineae bacterium]